MAASSEYALGSTYSVPFVQRSISSYLSSHMHPQAYAQAKLALPLTWDAAQMAALAGYPDAQVRLWATDPMMALGAERRVLSDPEAMETSRSRERDVSRRFQRSSGSITSTHPAQATDELWSRVRAAADYATASVALDDTVSLATALLENAEDGLVAPTDSVSGQATAVPSRVPSPPHAMSLRQMDQIRDAARTAQAMSNRAASLMNGVTGQESVAW